MPWISLVNRFIFLKQTLTIAINFSSRTFTATLWTQSFFTTKTWITRLVEWLTKQKSNIVNKKVFFQFSSIILWITISNPQTVFYKMVPFFRFKIFYFPVVLKITKFYNLFQKLQYFWNYRKIKEILMFCRTRWADF